MPGDSSELASPASTAMAMLVSSARLLPVTRIHVLECAVDDLPHLAGILEGNPIRATDE